MLSVPWITSGPTVALRQDKVFYLRPMNVRFDHFPPLYFLNKGGNNPEAERC